MPNVGEKMRTRAVGYIRVSTERQASEGVSLAAQSAKLQAYADLFDLELVAIEVDAGESAGSLERPGLQRALARLDAFEVSALVVVKLDRLTRSVRDLCDLVDTYFRDGQHSLLSVSEQIDTRSAAGRMMLNMLTVIGQWEREAIGERTKAALEHKRNLGEHTGGAAPYGYRVTDGKLEPITEEQNTIATARALHARGMSLRSIAAALPPSRTGRPFQATQIARML